MKLPLILNNVFSSEDLGIAEELAAANFKNLGAKYERYIAKSIPGLKANFPAAASFTDDELREIMAVADVVGLDSRGMMKRLKYACTCCGWCCSKTQRIVVSVEDADRISRKLKQKRDDLFVFDGKDWLIKDAHPCGWWNPRNGRCTIYNDRPHTCRVWPLGVNDDGKSTIIPQSECNYAIMSLVFKTMSMLEAAGAGAPGQLSAKN